MMTADLPQTCPAPERSTVRARANTPVVPGIARSWVGE
jgi:hypothetical protein